MVNDKKFLLRRGLLFLSVFIAVFCFFGISAQALSVDEYAPVFYFESEETCFPVDVSYHINNSNLDSIGEDPYNVFPIETSELDLSNLSSIISEGEVQNTYLDNNIGSVDDRDIIKDYQSKEKSLGYTVYYRTFEKSGNEIVQFWMFYAFNDGELNKHEGDWEMVQVVVPSSGSKWVSYSQHHSGQKANWNQIDKDENNIKVYVARGSHANYLKSFSGKLGIGMGSDYVGSNGKILKNGDYNLVELSDQSWLDYPGHWGEINSVEDLALGKAGPFGPKYRASGSMWDNPISWGNGLMEASDTMFMLEWFLYYFVEIFILVTIISLAILSFKIYRRHKKHGLGPRIVSMLYIDGFNIKTIGNILCFVGIFIAILGLFYNWYSVSADIDIEGYGTGGMMNLIALDGIKGMQVSIPGSGGAIPVAAVVIPFSLIIGIGIVFTIIASIGVYKSRKLGWKYVFRGVKIFLPILILLVLLMALGFIVPQVPGEGMEGSGNYISDLFGSISSTPWSGSKEIVLSISDEASGYINVNWGLGLGSYLLLFGGFVILFAGILEIITNKIFFEPKNKDVLSEKAKPETKNEVENIEEQDEKPPIS